MNRDNKLDLLFGRKKKEILSLFFTAGYPLLEDTGVIIENAERCGADMIEVGIPFSDPVADGSIIQQSSLKALENGMTMEILFSQLDIAHRTSSIPTVLMGYYNPVMQYGVKRFCERCQNAGIDGVIIPDLPPEEYEKSYKSVFKNNGIHFIMMVTPQTPAARIKKIADMSDSFIYVVSTDAITGGETDISARQEYFMRIREVTDKPFLIGFGIHDSKTFNATSTFGSGGIIGSAFIKAISKEGELVEKVEEFIASIRR